MRRRTYVETIAATVALSGCVGGDTETNDDPGDSNSPESEPTEVLRRNWEAYKNERTDEYIATYHSDSPKRETNPWENDDYWPVEDSSFTIEEREVVDQTDAKTIVHEKVRGEVDGDTSTWWSVVELRTDGDEWKVWDYEDVASEPSSE